MIYLVYVLCATDPSQSHLTACSTSPVLAEQYENTLNKQFLADGEFPNLIAQTLTGPEIKFMGGKMVAHGVQILEQLSSPSVGGKREYVVMATGGGTVGMALATAKTFESAEALTTKLHAHGDPKYDYWVAEAMSVEDVKQEDLRTLVAKLTL